MSVIKNMTLEICVDSIESAINAANGGADRLELCSALSEGGLSPTTALLKIVKETVKIPIFCMVRPRGGIMVYSKNEKDVLLLEAKELKEAGADGLVFGAITSDGRVDYHLCLEFIRVAGGLPCTFHRAFDLVMDPLNELEVVIDLGFQRILTSGSKSCATDGAPMIKELVKRSRGRIIIIAGAGVKDSNCLDLIAATHVTEIHCSAKVKKILYHSGRRDARMAEKEDDFIYVASTQQVKLIKSELSSLQNHESNRQRTNTDCINTSG